MATTAPRTRTGCTSCRFRHLKCDESKPICRRCQRSGRECVRGYNIRFRYGTDLGGEDPPAGGRAAGGKGGEFRFKSDQVWLHTLGTVSFVDETGDVTRNYNCGGSPSESPVLHATETGQPLSMISRSTRSVSINNLITSPTLSSPANGGFHSPIPRVNSHIYSSVDTYNRLHRVSKDIVHHPHHEGGRMPLDNMLHSPIQPRQPSYPFTRRTESVGPYNDQMDESNGVEIPSLHVSKIMWPLQDRQEAYLLRHYISYISKWFDMHDNEAHFQTVVPLKSATCPTLMNAMLALAARQLSHTAGLDPDVATQYHQMSIELIRGYFPILANVGPQHLDPSLLAATVLLRTFEELNVRYQEDAKDNQYHLACLSSLFRTLHPNLAVAGGLCQASFWIYLRQDIYISFVNKAPIKTNLDNFQLDRTFSPADDCTWANRITFKCAEILHFAFPESSTPAPSQTAWERLMDDVETWRMKRPAGFEMIYHAPRDPTEGKWFPDMWYTLDCHATGMQYYHLCRILLAIYNPANPGIHDGPSVARDASERLTQEVKDNVRAICGIAQSNRPEPAYFTACHAVVVCGVWFEDGMERRAMLKLLEDTERRSGWQTEKARKSLREMWGIPENDMESRERKEGPGICVNRGVGKMEEMW